MTDLLSEDELAGLKALGDVAATKDQLLSAIEAGAYQADITRFERAIWQLFDRARAVRLLLAENNNLRAHIDALKAERDGLKEECAKLAEAVQFPEASKCLPTPRRGFELAQMKIAAAIRAKGQL